MLHYLSVDSARGATHHTACCMAYCCLPLNKIRLKLSVEWNSPPKNPSMNMYKYSSGNFSIPGIFHMPGPSAPYHFSLWFFFASISLFFPHFFPPSPLHWFSFHQVTLSFSLFSLLKCFVRVDFVSFRFGMLFQCSCYTNTTVCIISPRFLWLSEFFPPLLYLDISLII
jgi:hypothetical protein